MLNRVSLMPTVFARARRTSVSFGMYPGVPMRRTSPKKLCATWSERVLRSWAHSQLRRRREAGEESVERRRDSLGCTVHQIKIAAVLVHDLGDDGVLPELVDRLRDLGREDGLVVALGRGQVVCEYFFRE
jgi:hypothetical protein